MGLMIGEPTPILTFPLRGKELFFLPLEYATSDKYDYLYRGTHRTEDISLNSRHSLRQESPPSSLQ